MNFAVPQAPSANPAVVPHVPCAIVPRFMLRIVDPVPSERYSVCGKELGLEMARPSGPVTAGTQENAGMLTVAPSGER